MLRLAAISCALALSSLAAPAAETKAAPPGELMPTARFAHVGTWYGKPPLAVLSCDVALRNPGPKPRWVVLPRSVGSSGVGGVRGVTVWQLPGSPGAWLWELEGLGGGWAVRLPPGGEATLRSWGLESWFSPIPATIPVEVVLADDLMVGGEPVARWTGTEEGGLAVGSREARVDRMKSKAVKSRQGQQRPDGLTEELPAHLRWRGPQHRAAGRRQRPLQVEARARSGDDAVAREAGSHCSARSWWWKARRSTPNPVRCSRADAARSSSTGSTRGRPASTEAFRTAFAFG
ncbi:MAG: hypothetical protein QM765_26370 [Myxococcales bacterium]